MSVFLDHATSASAASDRTTFDLAIFDPAAFARALLDPTLPTPDAIAARTRRDAAVRFGVYRNNVIVGLFDALCEAFPVVRALVGDIFFRAMAREFVTVAPPRSAWLAEYGDALPDFIAQFEPAAGLPYLADVARLERLRVHAYHAADAEPLAPADFAPWLAQPDRLAQLRVRLHPAARWMRSRYAVHSLWRAHQGELDIATIDPNAPEDVLVLRPQFDVHVLRLPDGGARCLDALAADLPLGDALASASHTETRSCLALLVQHGLAIALSDADPGTAPP